MVCYELLKSSEIITRNRYWQRPYKMIKDLFVVFVGNILLEKKAAQL